MNKAAEQLYVTQPSLTGAVKELEKELGITIFHRSGRGVSLTVDGEEFMTSCASAISPVRDPCRKIRTGRQFKAQVRRLDTALFLRGQGVCRNGKGLRPRKIRICRARDQNARGHRRRKNPAQ